MTKGTFGDHLKREREMRGVTLDEISAATRIATRFLTAIENEQWEQLPGGVFNRGFVRAVARFLAWRLASGQSACSADSSAYGKARGRLPEGVLRRLTRQTGQARHQQAPQAWQWHGRRVKVVDGTNSLDQRFSAL